MDEVGATIDVSDAVAMLGAASGQQQQQPEFKWTRESCLLLLHEYDLLKDRFKDRKNKKKDLWAEISMKFKKIYAYDLEWDVAYKKFRNLKQTFEQVRVKLNQQALLGQVSNRPKWPYYDKFVQILDDPPGSYAFSTELQQHHQLPVEDIKDHTLDQQHANQMEHHHHQQQQHQQQTGDQQQQHHHHHHHHHLVDPGTVGQVLGGEEFTESLVTVFPMGEELEIPSHPPPDSPPTLDEVSKLEDEEVVGTMMQEAPEEDEEEEEAMQDEMEPPHRKRYRRRSSYQQERLELEREKLHALREIQRGIDCKNDILQGILHVLQTKLWQAQPAND